MNKWEKITDALKVQTITKDNIKYKFTLTLENLGVLGSGRVWVLMGVLLDKPVVITQFWIVDDRHRTYQKESCNGQLWTADSVEKEANRIINDLVEKLY